MRRVCTGTLVHYALALKVSCTRNEWPGQGGGCGQCVRVHWNYAVQAPYQMVTFAPR